VKHALFAAGGFLAGVLVGWNAASAWFVGWK
jgi:hypothetical protein